ncbi:MAG: phosphoglycerate dehydrogenase [Candidatus Auribacterota bacterium]|jgi:D-3-phosphoglycerate dehydrogenase|nr:phosphoglycerate dehydrogenase [Candidatus Auribacterota bacterium]
MKILVADPLSPQGLEILEKEKIFEIINKSGMSPEELYETIKDCEGLIVRSGTTVTKEVLAAAKKLKVIGRAGVGVDNVDVPEATKRGVVVMNTPGGNTISTAEQTMALLLALARQIPDAVKSLKSGAWDRKKFKGVELNGKTLGIIGMGRIGKEVAKRARAFNMTILASDPFMSNEMAKKFEVELVSNEEIFKRSDFITVHTPLTDETRGLINAKAMSMMKKSVRLINCARGGIIDETDLLEALNNGTVAAAALDVYSKEPPENRALIDHPKTVTTPHLGASTEEAQLNVAIDIAYQIIDALKNGVIKNAVNAPSVDEELIKVIKPYVELAGKIGRFLSYIISGQIESVKILFEGKVAVHDMSLPTSAFLEGLLKKAMAEEVNSINAAHMAHERGIKVEESKSAFVEDFTDAITAILQTDTGTITLRGTFFGIKNEPRIIQVNNYLINAIPNGKLLYVINKDYPGVIGNIGTILGKHGINIADMTVGRHGDVALTLINIDQTATDDVIKELQALDAINEVRSIEL